MQPNPTKIEGYFDAARIMESKKKNVDPSQAKVIHHAARLNHSRKWLKIGNLRFKHRIARLKSTTKMVHFNYCQNQNDSSARLSKKLST